MSERIDVNAAFDPELRQAQKDMDDYVNSRPETDEGAVDVLETQGTYDDAIDRAIAADPRLRRMAMLANEIREIGDKTVTVKDAEQLSRMHNDKQDKLAELLQEYQDSDSAPEIESKDDVINRIINRTEEAPAEKLPTEKVEAVAKESEADDDKNENDSDSTGKPEEKPEAEAKPEEAPEEKEETKPQDGEGDKQEAQARKSEKVSDDEFDQNDMDELRKKLDAEDAAEEYKPKHRAEFADEDTPLFDSVKRDLGQSDESAREDESKDEFEARQPGRHAKTGAADLEILDEDGDGKKVDAKDLEILEEDTPADKDASGIRVRDWLRHPLASAGGAMAGAKAERSGENNDRSRRKKRLAGFILFGSAIGGGLLMMKGHNPFDHSTHGVLDNIPTVPEVPPAGTGPQVPPAEGIDIIKSIRVNPGDGEIKVTQSILEQMGIHVNAADAQRIGEHAHVDLLLGDHNYDDASSTLNRVGGGPGLYNIRPGSVEALVQSAKDLGLDK